MSDFSPSAFRLQRPAETKDTGVLVTSALAEAEGLTLRDYWRVIQRRRWLILLCCVTTVAITALIILLRPTYTAETTLLLERNAPRVLDFREVQSEQFVPDEYDFYKTQFEILKSRSLAASVLQEQGLETHALFAGADRPGHVARLWAPIQGWIMQQGWGQQLFSSSRQMQEEDPQEGQAVRIRTYLTMLDIKPIQRTRLVKIVFHTPEPMLSARLADAHAQAYIRQGLRLRLQANEEAQQFLHHKLVELKSRVEQSEAVLKEFRRTNKIIALDEKDNPVVARLAALNKQWTEVEAERIGVEAQLHTIRKRDYEALPAISAHPTVQTLKQQLAQREAELAQLATVYKPGHPHFDAVQAQVDNMRRKLRDEVQKIASGIEGTYNTALLRERALRDKMEEQRTEVLHLKDAAVQYAMLSREVDTNRQLYDSVLQRLKEAGVVAELQASNVSIIDQAQVPLSASTPYKKALLLSALLGLAGGLGSALWLHYLDNTFKTPQEIEPVLHLPALGVVPDFSRLRKRQHTLQTVVTESYRTLRSALLLAQPEAPPHTLLFTSANHGEGKTVSVINTAIVFAQTGAQVVVIDADLRRSHCHHMLACENGRGLTEVLTGQSQPEEVIKTTAFPHLFLLSAGSSPPDPAELLGSYKMQELLTALQASYDFIFIDAPPVLPASDAALLSTFVDGVVLVVSREKTAKQTVVAARAALEYARAKIIGVVFNRAELPCQDRAETHAPPSQRAMIPALLPATSHGHAPAYNRPGLRLRLQVHEDAQQFLHNKLLELQDRLEQSEATLKAFRRTNKITILDEKDRLVVERLSALHKRLTEAEAERMSLEAQIYAIRKRQYDALPAITTHPAIQTLKQQVAQREEELEQLAVVYQSGHPRLDAVQAQVDDLQRKLHDTTQKTVSSIESAYITAMVRERALRDKLAEQRADVPRLKDAAVQHAMLTREVDTTRQLYHSLLQQLQDAGAATAQRASNVSTLDPNQLHRWSRKRGRA